MPVFNQDMADVSIGFTLLEEGIYEFKVGAPKTFVRTNQKGVETFGVRYPLEISAALEDADESFVGKKQITSCYLHNEGSVGMAKQFVMCCLGYKPDTAGQAEFDEEYRGRDWAIDDFEGGPVSEMWQSAAGQIIRAECSVTKPSEGQSIGMQQFTWFPVK